MYFPVKILNNRWMTAISTNFRDQNLTVGTWFFWKNNALFCLSITSTSIYVNLLLIKIKKKWRLINSTKQIYSTKSVVNILFLDTSERFLLSQIKLNKSKRSLPWIQTWHHEIVINVSNSCNTSTQTAERFRNP